MAVNSVGARRRVWVAVLVAAAGLSFPVACGTPDRAAPAAPSEDVSCVDHDGDGFGQNCWAGVDCNDQNPKETCNHVSPCQQNPYAKGCPCSDGETHDCGEVTKRSAGFVTCGFGSVSCSGGVWSDCAIDSQRTSQLSTQRFLALGKGQSCGSPCDPNCTLYNDIPDLSILNADGGRPDPAGQFNFTDGGMSIGPADAGIAVGPKPDGAPPPVITPVTPAELVPTKVICATTVEAGATLSCQVTIDNSGGGWATTFTNDLRLSADSTIDGTDVLLDYCGVSSLASAGTVTITCSGTVPAGTTPGGYQVGVVVDSGATVAESDETNNTLSAAVTVVPPVIPPPPTPTPADLTATMTCTSTVNPGGTLSCDVTIKNTGAAWVPEFENSFYLSPDATIDGTDLWLKDCAASHVDSGGTTTLTCSTTISTTFTPGAYYAGFYVDADLIIPETDETNNTAAVPVTVVAAPSTLPDLIVSAVTCAPTPVAAGAWVSCNVDVQNTGLNYAGSSTLEIRMGTSSTTLGSTVIGTCAAPAVAGGVTTTLTCPGLVPSVALGTYYYQAYVDSANVVVESSNTNNWKSTAASTVTAAQGQRADLVADGVTCFASGASPAVDRGTALNCSFNIRNEGAATATNFANSIKLSTSASGTPGIALTGMTCPNATLTAGASTNISCSGTVPTSATTVPDGLYYLVATVDSGSIIPESSEANNTAFAFVSVPAFSHNIILSPGGSTSPIAAPNSVFSGLSCGLGSFTGFTVVDEDDSTDFDGPPGTAPYLTNFNCNEGSNGTCNGQTWPGGGGCGLLGLGNCNAVFVKKLSGSFLSNPKVTYQVPSTFPTGCYDQVFRFNVEAFLGCDLPATITIPGDPTKCATLPGSPATKPDIRVNSVSCGSPVTPGATLTCKLNVTNPGVVDTVPFTNQITTTITGMAAMTCSLPNGLPAGSTQDIPCTGTVPAGATAGVFNVTGTADTGNAVSESNEGNNTITTTGAVSVTSPSVAPGAPDIVVTSITCPATVNFGDTLACSIVLTNQGGQAASVFDNDLRVSSDPTVNFADAIFGSCGTANLPAGGSVTLKCSGEITSSWTVPGPWYAGVIADSGGTVAESNEMNNVSVVLFTVTEPPTAPLSGPTNIVISNVVCPANVTQGDTLACDVTFANAGGAVAGSFDDELHLSSDTAITSGDTLLGNCGVSALGVGASVTVKCSGMVPASTPAATWYAGIIADSTDAITEGALGEMDNTRSVAVQVNAAGPPPGVPADIVVDSVDCPDNVNAGDPFSCTVVVSNRGAAAAPAFTIDFRLSVDKTIDGTDTPLGTCSAPALAASASATVTCSGTLPATATRGLYMYGGVMADSNGDVTESSETNNTSYDPFLVPPPPSSFNAAWYERDYDASTLCAKDKSPVWSLFDWESSTPSDSSIAFFVMTAATQAGLAAAVPVPLAVAARATASTPPGFGGGVYPGVPGVDDTQKNSVVVNDVLTGEDLPQHSTWLRIRMNFAPSTDGQSRPRLGRWGMQVSCQPSR